MSGEACMHPSGQISPDPECRHYHESHVNSGIVLRICKLCGEPDWRQVRLDIDRHVKDRLMNAVLVASQAGERNIAAQAERDGQLMAVSGNPHIWAEIDRALAEARAEISRYGFASWVQVCHMVSMNLRGRLTGLDRPPGGPVPEQEGMAEGGQGEGA